MVSIRTMIAVFSFSVGTTISFSAWGADSPRQQSQMIQAWDFGRDEDRNRDRQPDQWVRKVGRDYPRYLPVQIVARNAEKQGEADSARRLLSRCYLGWKLGKWPWQVVPETVPLEIDRWLERSILNPCLELTLDGGAIEIQAPKFSVETSFSYAFELEMETIKLHGFRARAELVLFDTKDRVLQVIESPQLQGTSDWKTYRVGPIDIRNETIARGQIRIVVQPESGGGLTGSVRIDSVRVWKMPQLMIGLNQPIGIYQVGDPIQLRCTASGLITETPSIAIELSDHLGKVVSTTKIEIPTKATDPSAIPVVKNSNSNLQRDEAGGQGTKKISISNQSDRSSDWKGDAVWDVPELAPGFYTIRCELARSNAYVFSREASLVVVPKEAVEAGDSRFGWTLPSLDGEVPIASLPNFLKLAGVRGAKIPIWIDPEDEKRSNELAWLVERLKNLNVETIGVLDQPPSTHARHFNAGQNELTMATIIEQESVWQALLEPVLTRMCMELKHFQAGWDRDKNFTGNDALISALGSLRSELKNYGAESLLIAPWNALQEPSPQLSGNVDRIQLHADPSWTPAEIRNYVASSKPSGIPFWISLDALDAKAYSLTDRLNHLLESMVAVAESKVDKAWVTEPFSPNQDFMRSDGRPGFLFLPFRQLSFSMADKEYLGPYLLPGKSQSHVFVGSEEAIMLLSNTSTIEERLHLGEQLSAIDLFGRSVELQSIATEQGVEHVIPVSPWPIIVKGIDPHVARWATGIRFENPIVETTLSGQSSMKLEMANPTPSPIRGSISLNAPEVLQNSKSRPSFILSPNSVKAFPIEVAVRPDATSQKTMIRLDVEVSGQKQNRFSVYREVQIGSGDLELSMEHYIDENDNLIVTIELVNHSGRVGNFECMILTQDRPRERTQILNVMERATSTVVLKDGSSLVGKSIWFRCQEIGTGRIINERLMVVER